MASINENSPKCTANVPKINITPLDHQRAVVAAMIEHEKNCSLGDTSAIIRMLTDLPGSGKTLEQLMLVALSPLAPIRQGTITRNRIGETREISNDPNEEIIFDLVNPGIGYDSPPSKDNNLWKFTMIVVADTVFDQWCEIIRDNTEFKFLAVGNDDDLINLANYRRDRSLNDYEIIIVKNFIVDKTTANRIKFHGLVYTLDIIGEMFSRDVISRLMVDDFDFIGTSDATLMVPALFTWIISATTNQNKQHFAKYETVRKTGQRYTIYEAISQSMSRAPKFHAVHNNAAKLKTIIGISCDEAFIHNSMDVAGIHYYQYSLEHPSHRFIQAIDTVDKDLAELLNSDAIATAANKVGISATSISDIFERLLKGHVENYKHCLHVEAYIVTINELYDALPEWFDDINVTALPTAALIEKWVENLNKPGPKSWVIKYIKGKHESIAAAKAKVVSTLGVTKSECRRAFQRVQDNLRHGECPITSEDLSSTSGIFIAKCCGLVVAQEALPILFRVGTYHYGAHTCPNCRSNIKVKDFIYIAGDNVGFEQLLDESAITQSLLADQSEPSTASAVSTPAKKVTDKSIGPKFECLLGILQGHEPAGRIDQTGRWRIDGVMDGFYYGQSAGSINAIKGSAPINQNKVIIFAYHEETVTKVKQTLTNAGLHYEILSAKTAADQQKRFALPNTKAKAINILIIRGPNECAGLNLQMATKVIYMHMPNNDSVEKQLAARAMRHGRKFDLDIYYILYNHENADNRHGRNMHRRNRRAPAN